MAMRATGTNCWISVSCVKEGENYTTHIYCQSRLRGLKCPLEGTAGAKPFELSPACLKKIDAGKSKNG